MAEIDDVLDGLAADINTAITPYQPNIPPNYPNAEPTAGQIVATMVAPGQPLMLPVTNRLENGEAQVAIYASETGGRVEGEIRTDEPTVFTSTTVTYETGRQSLPIFVEIWASDRPKVDAISTLVRQHLGDVYSILHADGTVTKLLYAGYADDESEQAHSVYIRRMTFRADYTTTTTYPGAPVTDIIDTVTVVATIGPYSPLANQL